jgi:gluconate 2-dehydrogenase gamma chain
MERVLPSDDGPGAREADAAGYADWYARQPGFRNIQHPLVFGLGLLEQLALSMHGASFAACTPGQQDEVLRKVQNIPHVTAQRFFSVLVWLTLSGFLCPPEYGGNQRRAGWDFIGFTPHPLTVAAPAAPGGGRHG